MLHGRHASRGTADRGRRVFRCHPKAAGFRLPSLTTFIADDSVSISLDKSPAVASRFLLLNESPEIAGYVRAYENLNQFEKE